jgi:hypothetical protein
MEEKTQSIIKNNTGELIHNILEPVLGRPSKKESKTRILVEPLEPRVPRLHVYH